MKHVGLHENKKIVVVFREIPEDTDYALVTYSDEMSSQLHDDIMTVLESNAGQSVPTLADELHRSVGSQGTNLLHLLHSQKLLKRVPTSAVLMTPIPNRPGVRLDEINREIRKQLDTEEQNAEVAPVPHGTTPALTDQDIAKGLLQEIEQIDQNIKLLKMQKKRHQKEAHKLDPELKPNKIKKKAKN